MRIKRKYVKRSEEIPPFYGVSYVDWAKDEAVCHPIGINLIVLLWHEFKRWIKFPKGRL